MSFSEKTWQTGDIITADLLNRLEQALASHDTNIGSVLTNLGDFTKLSTSSKKLVDAINEVKGIIPAGGSGGSGSLVYNTLTDLQNAYPNGTTQPAWVIGDNAWYYWSGTVTVSAPADVTGLATSSIAQTSLTLSWTGSTGATSYDVYNGSTLLGNTTSTSYIVSNLSASTAYTFKIIAKNSGGSSAGVTVNATTLAAATPPANVTNLATSNVSNTSATLTWTSSSGATSYDVYNGSTLLGNTTSTSYQATGLSASTAYVFKVVAKNAAGSASGATLNVTTLASAPNPVTSLTVGTIQPSTVAISWTAPSGGTAVDHYEVAYEASGATAYTVASSAVNSSSTSFTVTNLHQSTAYTIRVVAIDASGNRSQATTVSATTIALTANSSPAAGTYTSSQTVTLSSNGVAGTNIYFTTNGSTPTTSSTLYSSAITVSATETIKFIAVNPVGDQSAVQIAAYTINLPDTTPPIITASPVAGSYSSSQTVTLTANETSTIYYTLDGSTPTTASAVYSSPIAISATTTLTFIGKDTAGNVSTPVSAVYTITTNSSGTQNAYIQEPYLYVNPSTILTTDIAQRAEGEASHIYFSMSNFIQKVNLSLVGSNTVNASNASNVFNGVIPYAGDQALATFTSGSLSCPDTCYITNGNVIYIRIPAAAYANNSNSIPLALYSITQRLPILHGVANDVVVITDAIINAMTSLSTVTVSNGMWTGFANLSAGLGTYTSITTGVNSICGSFISSTTNTETWYVNATTRLNFKIPQANLATCDLPNIQQYLKTNRLTFWIAK